MNRNQLEDRVLQTANELLQEKKYVSLTDVYLGVRYLYPTHVEDWERGRIPYLEKMIQAGDGKMLTVIQCYLGWVRKKNLTPVEIEYSRRTKGAAILPLHFTQYSGPSIEKVFRTIYVHPKLTDEETRLLKEKLETPRDLLVFFNSKDSVCGECGKNLPRRSLIFLYEEDSLCMECAGLGDLEFLPRGDAKITRNAKKNSSKFAVVLSYSKTRKRYERQGLLVEPRAVRMAEVSS